MHSSRQFETGTRRSWNGAFVALTVALLAMFTAGRAVAALHLVGTPHVTGSWTQRFQEDGVGNFDHVQILATTGGPFETPNAQLNFSDGSWSQTCNDNVLSAAAGDPVTLLQEDVTFQGPQSSPLSFYFQAFSGPTLLQTAFVYWDGGNWHIDNSVPGSASWNGGAACGFTDAISGFEPQSCLTSPAQCLNIPIDIARNDPTQVQAYSVTFRLTNLAPCTASVGNTNASITQGTYLSQAGGTDFHAVDNGDGTYTVDCAILGPLCSPPSVAQQGNLFNVSVRGVAEGVGTLEILGVVLRDCQNATLASTFGPPVPVTYDQTAPLAIADLAASRLGSGNGTGGIRKVRLTWSGASGSVTLYRKPFGNYPEYDDDGVPPPSSWQAVASGATSPYDDTPPSRDFWQYEATVTDACGNTSVVSNVTAGTLDYVLGDVMDPHDALAIGDNVVDASDISRLGAHYGLTGEAAVDPYGDLDVGPTTDYSVNGRPKPDDVIGFEDLMMFAIDYGTNVQAPQFASTPAPGAVDEVTLAVPAQVAAGQVFTVAVRMKGAGDIQAVSAQLGWDRNVAEPVTVSAGDLVAGQNGVVFSSGPGDVDAALLGVRDVALSGDGVLAIVTFRALASGDPHVGFARLVARDANNRSVALGQAGRPADGPMVTSLQAAAPNPFHESAQLGFSLAQGGNVSLAIYSVDGRKVRTLYSGTREAGAYRAIWNGRDDAGKQVQPGVFFARLVTPGGQLSRAVTFVK